MRLVSSFKLLMIPVILYLNWEVLAPYVAQDISNPFRPLLRLSHRVPSSDPDVRYAKGYLDLVFIAYHIIFFSFVRQVITVNLCRPIARYFGMKRVTKLDRFGEQGYAFVYFAVMGIWGCVSTCTITFDFPHRSNLAHHDTTADILVPDGILLDRWVIACETVTPLLTPSVFSDYPHWAMKPELKRYYLMQSAYWCQQLIVLLLRLEKPRKDYNELVAHHLVTLWLIGYVSDWIERDNN
jgi:acyl-CoA-dependent ceramide synthase